jgi:hypothetical protein
MHAAVQVTRESYRKQQAERAADQHEVNVLKKPFEKLAISKAIAQERHIAYKQYRGHWSGWVLVRVKRRVVTKAGVAFEAGDFTHARKDEHSWQLPVGGRWVVYSHRNGVDTALASPDVELVQ